MSTLLLLTLSVISQGWAQGKKKKPEVKVFGGSW